MTSVLERVEATEVEAAKAEATNGVAHVAADVAPKAEEWEGYRPLKWTTEMFESLESRSFEGHRVCLIEGVICEEMGINGPHNTATALIFEELRRVFSAGDGYFVRSQLSLNLTSESNPIPDCAVVRGGIRDYATQNPTTALMVVEISDTTLRDDRRQKASLYARAQIAEYWIVNLRERQLEVLRSPVEDAQALFGWGYRDRAVLSESESIAPLERPEAMVRVADLLP